MAELRSGTRDELLRARSRLQYYAGGDDLPGRCLVSLTLGDIATILERCSEEPGPRASIAVYVMDLMKLERLPRDLDGSGPVDREAAHAVRVLLEAIVEGRVQLVPLADGGVQVEAHYDGYEVEIEFSPKSVVAGSTLNQIDGVWERVDVQG